MPTKPGGAPRRGRPRKYDPDTALGRATLAFWRGGFAGTSFDALAGATRMNKPSLYGAVGDKRDWYLAALDRYVERSRAALDEALAPDAPLAAGLARAYDRALALYFGDAKAPLGCFLIGTAASEAPRDAAIRARLGGALRDFGARFEARFAQARARREISRRADPALLADLAAAVLFSIALRARAGHSRAALSRFAQGAVAQLCAA